MRKQRENRAKTGMAALPDTPNGLAGPAATKTTVTPPFAKANIQCRYGERGETQGGPIYLHQPVTWQPTGQT